MDVLESSAPLSVSVVYLGLFLCLRLRLLCLCLYLVCQLLRCFVCSCAWVVRSSVYICCLPGSVPPSASLSAMCLCLCLVCPLFCLRLLCLWLCLGHRLLCLCLLSVPVPGLFVYIFLFFYCKSQPKYQPKAFTSSKKLINIASYSLS